jgi:hypothetical protein
MNFGDKQRKEERVELLRKMLKEAFGKFEELAGKGGRCWNRRPEKLSVGFGLIRTRYHLGSLGGKSAASETKLPKI